MMTSSATRPRERTDRRAVNGMILLDKPAGMTSNAALQRVKYLLEARKGGHTGSLDPIATGLLPLCFGEATKVSGFFLAADKRYWTRVRLGESTETGDSEGAVVRSAPVTVSAAQIRQALAPFCGEIEQVPPMFSAIKQNGQPLYKLARQGIEVEREARRVVIYELELVAFEPPFMELEIHCSSGFYVRSLAEDLGDALGCGGHVVALRRLAVGSLGIDHTVTLDALQAAPAADACRNWLIGADQGLAHLPRIDLAVDAAYYLCRGQPVRAAGLPAEGWVRLYADGAGFLGVGTVAEDGKVTPKRLFHS